MIIIFDITRYLIDPCKSLVMDAGDVDTSDVLANLVMQLLLLFCL